MTTTVMTLIGTALTVVIGPLLAWLIKRWWDNKAAQIEAEKRRKAEEEAARKNSEGQSHEAGEVNASIDAQRAAREKWAKENPGKPLP